MLWGSKGYGESHRRLADGTGFLKKQQTKKTPKAKRQQKKTTTKPINDIQGIHGLNLPSRRKTHKQLGYRSQMDKMWIVVKWTCGPLDAVN